jgi:hypothetical protein
MSGGGQADIFTQEDVLKEEKIIEDNASLKDILIELRKIKEYLQVITGEDLC